MSTDEKIAKLRKLRSEALEPSNQRAVDRQHDLGKLTARERITLLLDKDSFQEFDVLARHQARGFGIEERRPAGDAVVTGYGTVDGRHVFVFAEDFTQFGGSLGEVVADKICKVMDLAMDTGSPLVGIKDSGGARIQEGVVSLDGYGSIGLRDVSSIANSLGFGEADDLRSCLPRSLEVSQSDLRVRVEIVGLDDLRERNL